MKIQTKNSKRIPYDSRQRHFTTYPNFQEFVNAKKVICKCGQIISLGINYQVANFKRHSESNNCNFLINNQPSVKAFFTKSNHEEHIIDDNNIDQNLHICKGLCDLEYIDYVINSPANFGGGKKPEIIAKQLFPQKFPANKSFSRRKLSKSELQEFKRALEAETTWRLEFLINKDKFHMSLADFNSHY